MEAMAMATATSVAAAAAAGPPPPACAQPVRPQVLAAQCLDHIALEGRAGVAVAALFAHADPRNDSCMRRQVWQLLQRQHARGVLHFYYRAAPAAVHTSGSNGSVDASTSSDCGTDAQASSSPALIGKKRKRPISSQPADGNVAASPAKRAPADATAHPESSSAERAALRADQSADMSMADDGAREEPAIEPSDPGESAATTAAIPAVAKGSKSERKANNSAHMKPHARAGDGADGADPAALFLSTEELGAVSLEDALGGSHRRYHHSNEHRSVVRTLMVVACFELRFRALNIPVRAILAELVDEHFVILEAVGRARVQGITVTGLGALFQDGSVKRLHNALDTLISYNLVVKRMMIVAKPAMRRLNIIHLPRFAADFAPPMFDESAEFESDEAYKKILCGAAESYLQNLQGHSCVLTDMGRDLNLQKRHLEILRGHVMHEAKRDDHYPLELFQAVLRPTKKNSMEPKILNCIRLRPSKLQSASQLTTTTAAKRRGVVVEMGLLHQIYTLIEESGEHGSTISEMRSQIGLPGSKLPYKLVSILAGTYGLKAETIILGKNKAFRLYLNSVPTAQIHCSNTNQPLLLLDSGAVAAIEDGESGKKPAGDVFSIRANLALRDALGGIEKVDGTRSRRRNHILHRLVLEKIISLSSLRASVFGMEKQIAEMESSLFNGGSSSNSSAFLYPSPHHHPHQGLSASSASSAVGMVDTRSISRIAEELEREGSLRLLQLPLPAKNVSTKFRALKCVVFPGFENDEAFIQGFVKNYCRDERLRRIHQNTERNQIRLQSVESDDDDADVVGDLGIDLGLHGRTAGSSSTGDPSYRGKPGRKRGVKRSLSENGEPAPHSAAEDDDNSDAAGNKRNPTSTALVVLDNGDNGGSQSHEISYRIRRFVSQTKSGVHSHQYRKLGFAYGVMYRCKVFHKFLWTFLHSNSNKDLALRDDTSELSIGGGDVVANEASRAGGAGASSTSSGVVFSRETVLHSMPVHLYIVVFSGGEVLSPSEMAQVEDAVAHKRLFSALPDTVRDKIWSHESQRTAKVLGTLTDLDLIHPHKIGMKSLIKILRAGYTDGRDGVLSRALKDNALGGLFKLQTRAQIVLDDKSGDQHSQFYPPGDQQMTGGGVNGTANGTGEQRKGVNELKEIRLVGTTEKNYSFSSILPLRFTFDSEREVDRYWEALECLCLEQMVMEVSKPKRNEPAVCEVPKPMKTRARRMLRILAWISKSRKPTPPSKTAAVAVDGRESDRQSGGKRVEKRSGIVSKSFAPRVKRRLVSKDTAANSSSQPSSVAAHRHLDNDDGESSAKPHRRQRATTSGGGGFQLVHEGDEHDEGDDYTRGEVGGKSSSSSLAWTDENERDLLAFFIENCKTRWKITIPQGLQRDAEAVAFRTPNLSRSGFGLVTIARKLGKRRIDVKKRLKEKLMEPAAKLLFEEAKRDAIRLEHPSGVFDEEAAIFASSRLTALFRRAVMMVVSPQEEYHPLVAEELISFWTAQEIRLVWRYLWLKNWIVRATERERVRGYTTSQRLQDFLKLTTLSYPLWLFRQAAEHESMIHSTLEEITTNSNAHGASSGNARAQQQHRGDALSLAPSSQTHHSTDQLFEAEFPVNATPGQCALELACQVLGTCSLIATHSPVSDYCSDDESGPNVGAGAVTDPDERAAAIIARKRNLRFLNYKNMKGGSGFAAHLAKHVNFKKPSLLIDSWQVETKLHAVTLEDREQLRQFEAFSLGDANQEDAFLPYKRRRKSPDALQELVIEIVKASGESGVTLPELMHRLRSRSGTADEATSGGATAMEVMVDRCLNTLVDDGALLCVNAYFDQRYVVKDHGDVWLLRPFSLVSGSKSTPRVVFEGEKDTLSFPWLKMDGSTNYKFLFSIQRKLLAFVLQAPGITEQSVYVKMDKLLTLQDTREALSLLVEEGLVYVRGATVSSASLFAKKRKRGGVVNLVNLVGNALNADREKVVVHYFPHVECIQRFGSIVQDYQSELL